MRGAKALGDKARELREELAEAQRDDPERVLVEPLLPGQNLRYVGLSTFRLPELHKAGSQFVDGMTKELAETFDPRVLFGLLNIVNPVLWVEAVIWPVRRAAEFVMLPIGLATTATQQAVQGTGDAGTPERPESEADEERQVPLTLTAEQEAFRAMFRLSRHRPLAEQLAEIAYKWRYVFSGELASSAGSLLLFLVRHAQEERGVGAGAFAVTDTHLHLLLDMGQRPVDGGPDTRRPRLSWSLDRRHIVRIDAHHGATRLVVFPFTITFDDGSWIRLGNFAGRKDQWRFYAAFNDIPGNRPRPGPA
ncbi:hypothetical protein [Plantactinospora endophytica]|nr:hypothetical protein [Plantactinospora endophytica]